MGSVLATGAGMARAPTLPYAFVFISPIIIFYTNKSVGQVGQLIFKEHLRGNNTCYFLWNEPEQKLVQAKLF